VQLCRVSGPYVSRLTELNAYDSLKFLLLLSGRHDFSDKQLNVVKIDIVTADILYFALDEVWMHQDILCKRLYAKTISYTQILRNDEVSSDDHDVLHASILFLNVFIVDFDFIVHFLQFLG